MDSDPLLGPLEKRAKAAIDLADAAAQPARDPAAGGKQVAWHVGRLLDAHALDCDASVMPPCIVCTYAAQVMQGGWEVLEAAAGFSLPPHTREQAKLARADGGLSAHDPGEQCHRIRAAALVQVGAPLLAFLQDLGVSEDRPYYPDRVPYGVTMQAAYTSLSSYLSPDGRPRRAAPAALVLVPWATLAPPRTPAPHLLSCFMRKASQLTEQRLLAEPPARLVGAGGPTSGRSLVHPPGCGCPLFPDNHWSTLLRWRLGVHHPTTRCANVANASGRQCTARPECLEDHSLQCAMGGNRLALHNGIAKELAQAFEDAGASVRLEVLVPEFAPVGTRLLDVWAYGMQGCRDLFVDVTIRSEMARSHGKPAAPQTDPDWRRWCQAQEQPKHREYPPVGGLACNPFVQGQWGRLAPAEQALLVHLAGLATTKDKRAGRAPAGRLVRWRTSIDVVLQMGVARRLLGARYGNQGQAFRPPHTAAPQRRAGGLGPQQQRALPGRDGYPAPASPFFPAPHHLPAVRPPPSRLVPSPPPAPPWLPPQVPPRPPPPPRHSPAAHRPAAPGGYPARPVSQRQLCLRGRDGARAPAAGSQWPRQVWQPQLPHNLRRLVAARAVSVGSRSDSEGLSSAWHTPRPLAPRSCSRFSGGSGSSAQSRSWLFSPGSPGSPCTIACLAVSVATALTEAAEALHSFVQEASRAETPDWGSVSGASSAS